MDRTTTAAPATAVRGLLAWHWNCNGYDPKEATLQQHLRQVTRRPDIIMLQETRAENVRLPGYRSVASRPKDRGTARRGGRGVCTMVKKGITFVEHELLNNSMIEHTMVEVVTGKKKKESTYIANVYSSPSHGKQKFKALLYKASKIAGPDNRLIICGDFNAQNQAWGYQRTLAKGRDLMQDSTDLGINLITDPTQPTRTGNSVTRDTTPDLTFVRKGKNDRADFEWRNTGNNLGSDHYIVEVMIPIGCNGGTYRGHRKHRHTDWDAFRKLLPTEQTDITDIEEWTNEIMEKEKEATRTIETEDNVGRIDSRLAHLIEAKQSIQARWKTQRTNRKLRKKVAELNREIEAHSRVLCTQQWNEVCNEADSQMHCGKTWSMLKSLLDDCATKSHQHDNLARIIHKARKEHGEDETKRRINNKYLPTAPTEAHPEYQGEQNEWLDRDIEVWEVRATLQDLNTKSAAGPDRVTNRALKNLNETAIENLTAYFNKCWRAGSLPRQWKMAKTILIPKPGKPPGIENLGPISLTSCVGKVLEHVLLNRWQRYLEDGGLYPNTIIAFRNKLGTQDAMIQLKHDILDDTTGTRDNKAILGLDLQSAFDQVRHSAILAQVAKLNMGRRTYAYIKDFLTNRTTEINAGDLRLPEKLLGSRLSRVAVVRHTIYADDVTLWVPGGSDGYIESTLQEAVEAIEEQLDGSGLICSPHKSELLVIPPKRSTGRTKGDKSERERDKIRIKTRSGLTIPEVEKIRVLGMLIERKWVNGETVKRVTAKVYAAIRLIKRVSNKKKGMKEESLMRLVQSFAISHVTYVAAFHNWRQCERNKINVLIRKAYKAALGLIDGTSTEKLLALEYNRERREARARALIDLHARDEGAVYGDAAEYPGDEKAYAAVVVQTTTGTTKAAASVRTRKAHRAEEVAIALAIADTECTTILSDSRTAVRNYARGRSR
ncbi:uncharacterized protein LOC144160638 [Haemaphysalis longicornis]